MNTYNKKLKIFRYIPISTVTKYFRVTERNLRNLDILNLKLFMLKHLVLFVVLFKILLYVILSENSLLFGLSDSSFTFCAPSTDASACEKAKSIMTDVSEGERTKLQLGAAPNDKGGKTISVAIVEKDNPLNRLLAQDCYDVKSNTDVTEAKKALQSGFSNTPGAKHNKS